ncbi:class I SAM-dependent methyltransferase [Streptomyces sp. NPDC002659]|uniref:class I SAM-dependent methyltransferase n=1 Tax=Streptomyces sp. NPDC002659 TaxID=3364656 RepID=UPI0036925A8F
MTAVSNEYADLTPLQARIQAHRMYSEVADDPDGEIRALLGVPAALDMLDIGCGTGEFLRTLAAQRHSGLLVGVDTSAEAICATRSAAGVIAMRASATELPFPEQAFDCVTARHMLYHVDDPREALREARRVLRLGGRFVATVNHREVVPRTRDMVASVVRDAGLEPRNQLTNGVNSETLPPLLQETFGGVHTAWFDNALVFPSAASLSTFAVALMSFCGVEQSSPLRDALAEEISARAEHWFAKHPGASWRDIKGYTVCSAVRRPSAVLS